MSVINQMLVDLERRRASGAERHRIPDHVRALPGDSPSSRPLAAIALGVVLLAVAAAGAGWWMQSDTVPPPAPSVPAPAGTAQSGVQSEEWIARRLSLDLARVPDGPAPAAIPEVAPQIPAAAVIGSRAVTAPAAIAAELPARPPVKVAEPAGKPVVAEKQAPPAETPPGTGIDKQLRAPTPRQRADTEYAKGAAALHQGQGGEARAAFEAALRIDPGHHAARQALVGVLVDSRRHGDAARVLQEGLQRSPEQHGFAMTLARLQVEAGELDAGVQTLARSADHPGASPDYFAFFAGLLQRQQKHAEAVTYFQRALNQRSGVGLWLLGLGLSFEALGRTADAQEAYRRARASGNLSADLQAFAEQRLR